MEYNAFKEKVLQTAREAGLVDYELYYQNSESTQAMAFQHEVNNFTSGERGGVCFRCVVDGKMGYASTEELSETQAVSIVRKAMDNARALENEDPVFLCEGGLTYQSPDRTPYPLPSTEELLKTMMDTQEKLLVSDSRVQPSSQTSAMSMSFTTAIANSRGLDLMHQSQLCGLYTVAVVSEGEETENEFEIKLGELSKLDTDALVKESVTKAASKLGAEVPPTAVCPVVFSPEAMTDLLGTYSDIFSSEEAQQGLSKLSGKEGQSVAAPCVTLVDDPFCKDCPVPMPFDGEGCPTFKKNVIEGGVLKTLLYNMKTAAKAGCKTTGNASKAGYNSRVDISPFAMYLEPGTCSEDELLQRAQNGVYINELNGLHAGANAVTGDFSLQSAGFLIENGRKTKPVKSFTVAGNFYELLNKITALSDTVTFPSAMDSTCFGSPSVLVDTLSIAGK